MNVCWGFCIEEEKSTCIASTKDLIILKSAPPLPERVPLSNFSNSWITANVNYKEMECIYCISSNPHVKMRNIHCNFYKLLTRRCKRGRNDLKSLTWVPSASSTLEWKTNTSPLLHASSHLVGDIGHLFSIISFIPGLANTISEIGYRLLPCRNMAEISLKRRKSSKQPTNQPTISLITLSSVLAEEMWKFFTLIRRRMRGQVGNLRWRLYIRKTQIWCMVFIRNISCQAWSKSMYLLAEVKSNMCFTRQKGPSCLTDWPEKILGRGLWVLLSIQLSPKFVERLQKKVTSESVICSLSWQSR